MIRLELKITSFLFFLLLFLECNAQGISVVEASGYTDVTFEIPTIEWQYDGQDSFPSIASPYIYEAGAPELPRVNYTLLFDAQQTFSYEVLNKVDTLVYASVGASRGFVTWDERNSPREQGDQYSVDAFYPASTVELTTPFQQRSQCGSNLVIYPFRYNAVLQELSVVRKMTVRVYHSSVGLRSTSLSLSQNEETQQSSMLVVVPDSFRVAVQPLLDWKSQKGIEIIVVSADTISSINSAVESYYATKQIDYLLLVGAARQVGTASSQYGAGDNNFGYVEGSDPYLDVFVGRLPANSTRELSMLVDKLVEYEKGLSISEKLFHFVGVASVEDNVGDNGEEDIEHIQNIASVLEGQGFSSEVLSPLVPGSRELSQAINEGAGLLCYAGHGDNYSMRTLSYNIDSMAHLKNTMNHPFFIDVACLNGAFTGGDCFATRLINANYQSSSVGVLGIVASTISQPWNPPMRGQDEMVNKYIESIMADTCYSLGSIVSDGLSDMINAYSYGGIETATTWNLFGDPSLLMWSHSPDTMQVFCDSVYDVRLGQLAVRGEDGALVSFFSGGEVRASCVIVNEDVILEPGIVTITDTIVITVTKNGTLPVQKMVVPFYEGGSYYGLKRFVLEDDNGVAENGETVLYKPVIRNFGDTVGCELRIEILTMDDGLSVSDSVLFMDSIFAGETLISEVGFEFEVGVGYEDQTTFGFSFQVSDASGQVNVFSSEIEIGAPIIEWQSILINGDVWQSGEWVFDSTVIDVEIVVANLGHAPSHPIASFIGSESPYVSIAVNRYSDVIVGAMSRDTFKYQLQINPSILSGDEVSLELAVDDVVKSLSLTAFQGRQVQLGDLSVSATVYPFYNYYKNNKTQFVVQGHELDSLGVVDSIGFYISSYPNSSSYTFFKNFNFSIAPTSVESFNQAYVESPMANEPTYTAYLPRKAGWHYFAIADLVVDGKTNLLCEITWGENYYYTPNNQSYEVMTHATSYNSVVYGYSDTQSPADFRKAAKDRPTLSFVPAVPSIPEFSVELYDGSDVRVDDFRLLVGQQEIASDDLGNISFALATGVYHFVAIGGADTLYNAPVFVYDSTTIIRLKEDKGTPVLLESVVLDPFVFYSNDFLHFDNARSFVGKVAIYSLDGRCVCSERQVGESHSLFVGNLKSGIYVVWMVGFGCLSVVIP